MYVIRRVYRTKPGQARNVAALVYKQGKAYQSAGQRSDIRVSYNGGTLPGEQDIVFLEWTDDSIQSPSREGHVLPKEALELGAEVRKLIEHQHIEFYEMLSPSQVQD